MTTSEEILIIANRLANQGKKPTVALVKTRLNQPVPLALLINTLKHWQHQSEHTELSSNTNVTRSDTKESTMTMESIEALISKTVKPLSAEIKILKQQIKDLETQMKHNK